MKISFRKPDGCNGCIFIYDISPLEFTPLFEEVLLTKEWVDRLYEDEKG